MIIVRFPEGGGFTADECFDDDYHVCIFSGENEGHPEVEIVVPGANVQALVQEARDRGYTVIDDDF